MSESIKYPNGMVYQDGQWYMQCGNDLVSIKYKDANGQPMVPKSEKVSSS